jgi:hypothetical protein
MGGDGESIIPIIPIIPVAPSRSSHEGEGVKIRAFRNGMKRFFV